jgi:uncharacterized protein (DUF2461 family)
LAFSLSNSDDLKRIRDIELNHSDCKILNSKSIRDGFIALSGTQVATFPRGFAKDHEAIDLIRHKQFILRHNLQIRSHRLQFVDKVNEFFKTVPTFFDYMSFILTTDLNGETTV